MDAGLVMATAAMPTGIDVTSFLQFGLLGMVFLCVVLKKYIVPEWTLKQLEEQRAQEINAKNEQIETLKVDKQELKDSLDQLQELTRTEIIPALVRANQLSSEYLTEIADRGRNA